MEIFIEENIPKLPGIQIPQTNSQHPLTNFVILNREVFDPAIIEIRFILDRVYSLRYFAFFVRFYEWFWARFCYLYKSYKIEIVLMTELSEINLVFS